MHRKICSRGWTLPLTTAHDKELCANLTTRGSVLASRPDNLSQCPARSPQPRQPPSDKTLGDVAA